MPWSADVRHSCEQLQVGVQRCCTLPHAVRGALEQTPECTAAGARCTAASKKVHSSKCLSALQQRQDVQQHGQGAQ